MAETARRWRFWPTISASHDPRRQRSPLCAISTSRRKNYTNEAKAAQNAPQGQQYAQGDADDFIDVTDDGDLQF